MKPLLANSEMSGRSRFPSFRAPTCQDGFVYPPLQVPSAWPFTVQLLTPPLPPTVDTRALSLASLQLVSAFVLQPAWLRIGLVQVSFHATSGMYPFADSR